MWDGKVAEGPGSCFFMVKDNTLVTPQLTDSVLESITRDTIIRLAKEELGLEVKERTIDRTELYLADEAFLCGSDDGAVSLHSPHEGKTDALIAAGGFHDDRVGFYHSFFFRLADHIVGRSCLDGAAHVQTFKFHQNFRAFRRHHAV